MFRSWLLLLNGFMMCLVMMVGIYHLSEALYHNPPPSRPAYNISGKELPSLPSSIKESELIAQAAPLPVNMSEGVRLFRQCAACHTITPQGANRVGPSLWNIVDRPVASLPNYRYSRALSELGQVGAVWDEERLNAYLTAPAQAVIGTTMAFRGLSDAQTRAAIIAYLRTLTHPKEQEKGRQEND